MKTIENTYISWVPKNHVIRELGRSSHSRPVTHSSCDMTALVEAGRPNWEGKHGKIGETLWFSLMFILKVGSCFSATSCCNNWFIWGDPSNGALQIHSICRWGPPFLQRLTHVSMRPCGTCRVQLKYICHIGRTLLPWYYRYKRAWFVRGYAYLWTHIFII